MLKIKAITNIGDLSQLAGAWNRVLSQSYSNNIFLTWEWVFNWWRIYGKNKKLFVLTLTDQNETIVAIAPFYCRKRRSLKSFWVNEVRFLGTGEDVSPDYLDIIVKKGFEDEAINAIVKYLCNEDGWDVLNLTDILSTSLFANKLKEVAARNGLSINEADCATCPYIHLPSSWEEYLSGLSKNTRYNVRRRTRNLEKQFKAKFFVLQNTESIDSAMERLAYLHNKRWIAKGSGRSFSTKKYNAFHRAVARDLANKGWLQLSCLELDGDIVGMYYDYCYRNKIYYYQGGFDPSLYKYSLGLVLRAYVIQKAIEDGLEEIDLLKGAYDHKYMWTNLNRHTVNLIVGNAGLGSKIFYFDTFKKAQIKASLKKVLPDRLLKAIKRQGK